MENIAKTFISKTIDIRNNFHNSELRKRAFKIGCKFREATTLENSTKLKVQILSELLPPFVEFIKEESDSDKKEKVNMLYNAGCVLYSCLGFILREAAAMIEDNIKEKANILYLKQERLLFAHLVNTGTTYKRS